MKHRLVILLVAQTTRLFEIMMEKQKKINPHNVL